MVKRIQSVVVGVALAAAAGCGGCGGPSGSGEPIPTSVAGNKRISDLTPTEHDQLCADISEWVTSTSFLSVGCNSNGWLFASDKAATTPSATDADLQATCESTAAACVASGVATNCSQLPPNCNATVSEYDTCIFRSAAAEAKIPPCSELTRAALAATVNALDNQTNTVCARYFVECPSMWAGRSSTRSEVAEHPEALFAAIEIAERDEEDSNRLSSNQSPKLNKYLKGVHYVRLVFGGGRHHLISD
jgi:hypothetical protein